MNPQTTKLIIDVENLKREITSIKAEYNLLKSANTIPIQIDQSFKSRFNLSNILSSIIGSGTTSATTQNITVPAGGATITVPAQPSGALTVTYKGTTYNLLYK